MQPCNDTYPADVFDVEAWDLGSDGNFDLARVALVFLSEGRDLVGAFLEPLYESNR